ncbi:MAG: M3 family peptidase, partial [Schleiferiaceae bacterium]|nr:M3 family peptidase [Schleiferiaceae bacterium]
MNPLIEFQPTVHQSLPFHLILPEHFMPAAIHWIEVSRNRHSDIVANPKEPTFANTLVELEFASRELDIVSSCFYNLNSAETNAEIQSIARELSPLLTEFSNETVLNESLFLKIKQVWDCRAAESLTSEQLRLLQETYEGYVRNGALLQGKDRESLKELSATLSKTSLAFGENVLKETQIFEFYTEQKSDLEGLPDDVIEQAE